MDRQSNGSFVVKDRVMNSYKSVSIMDSYDDCMNDGILINDTNQGIKTVVNNDKESKVLKNIDSKIMTIDDMLNNMENN